MKNINNTWKRLNTDLFQKCFNLHYYSLYDTVGLRKGIKMFCSNCGKEVDDNTKYCPECGFSLKGEEVSTTKQSEPDDRAHCPKCNSTDIHIGQKGYNDDAIGCGCILGILGFFTFGISWILLIIIFLSGFAGSGDSVWICKKCGHKWEIKNREQEQQRIEKEVKLCKNIEKAGDGCSKTLWTLFWILLAIVFIGIFTGVLKPDDPEPTKSYDEMTSKEKQEAWINAGNIIYGANERSKKMFSSY